MSPVRIFSGGLHMKSNRLCLIISFLLSITNICILPIIALPNLVFGGMLIFSIIITIIVSPLINQKRPIKTKLRYLNLKKKASIFVILSSILLFLLSINEFQNYFTIGVWALFINSVQLLFIHISNIRKGEHYANFQSFV